MIETTKQPESCVLVGIITPRQDGGKVREYLDELEFLVDTAGGVTRHRFVQKVDYPDPRTCVGSGKLQEIRDYIKWNTIDTVIFDEELTPSQIRNLEKALECKVLDRSNLILDIFARRARTAHAKTQVELAQYEFLLPRLTRMWTHLEKQQGGIGLKGPGETEIETDRRIIREKIALLKKKLEVIDKQKASQRKHRTDQVRVALVGYTNVGKSTIMNLLSKSDVFAENKLFATLDTTVRKVVIGTVPLLLSDTVGFIRKLPHMLIESFKSTLDEVREADIIVHVVDISHPGFEEQLNVVKQTLLDIKVVDKPTLHVFNKIDAYTYEEKDPFDLTPSTPKNYSLEELSKSWMAKINTPAIFISATQKENVEALRQLLLQEVVKILKSRYPHNTYLY
ncbi:MAG: GTPase HflX [Bacteroidales bacterium]